METTIREECCCIVVVLCAYINECVTFSEVLERKLLAMVCMALLCPHNPWMYLFVHLNRRWGHVSISLRGQRVRYV